MAIPAEAFRSVKPPAITVEALENGKIPSFLKPRPVREEINPTRENYGGFKIGDQVIYESAAFGGLEIIGEVTGYHKESKFQVYVENWNGVGETPREVEALTLIKRKDLADPTSGIEKGLLDSRWQDDAARELELLELYLDSEAKDLTLDQYKNLRSIIDKVYRPLIEEKLEEGTISKDNERRVNDKLEDYIRSQHTRLKNEYDKANGKNIIINQSSRDIREMQSESRFTKVYNFFGNTANNIVSRFAKKPSHEAIPPENETKTRNNIRTLEKILLEQWIGTREEREIIDSLPEQGLNTHQVRTLRELMPRTRFKHKLSQKLRNYNRQV